MALTQREWREASDFRSPRVVMALVIATAILSIVTPEAAQRSTIPEALAAAGRSLFGGSTGPSGPPPALADVLAETDLIVRGFIGTGRSYLSEDEMNVLTEVPVESPVVIYERDPERQTKPGPATPLTLTLDGGTVRVGELTYTQTHGALPTLERNTECLLLLKKVKGRYHVAGRYYGAFELKGERMIPLTRMAGFASELRDRPIADGLATILQQLRSIR